MKRHPSLVPLSHDHHHTLVEARRLRKGAAAAGAERQAAAASFLRYFSSDIVRHFRVEEELLFPLGVDAPAETRDLLVRALLDHQRLHALARELERRSDAQLMGELADVLESHVRFEERELFPLIEAAAASDLERLELADADNGDPVVVHLFEPLGRGPVWGTESADLNATLLVWPAGHVVSPHVNSERDVLLLVIEGSATVSIEGREHALEAGDAVLIAKGQERRIAAGPEGVRYLTAHYKRGPLQIAPVA